MRPVYNRPEMLYLSIAAEKKAREHYDLEDLTTLFVVEHGSPDITLKLIDKYPFPKKCIFRDRQYGLTINILEGMKTAFEGANDYIIYIEDDILVHKTYFQYMDVLMGMKEPFSVLSSYCKEDGPGVRLVFKDHHYAALAPLISKHFHQEYILPHSVPEYYSNPPAFVTAINNKYMSHKCYKYKDTKHWEQAGMINRLVDVALIEEGLYVLRPEINRHMHIGYYGKNRQGELKGKTFKERLGNLIEIVKSPDRMYQEAQSKQYDDYKVFSERLKTWDGTLIMRGLVKELI
jgi:hypothetical protein